MFNMYFFRLFPIKEQGLNWHAQELQQHEIEVRRLTINLYLKLCKTIRELLIRNTYISLFLAVSFLLMSALTVLMSAYYFSNLNIFLENYDLKVYTNHDYVMLICYM